MMKIPIVIAFASAVVISCGEKSKASQAAQHAVEPDLVLDHNSYTALTATKLHASPSVNSPQVQCEIRTDDCGQEACMRKFTTVPIGTLLQIEARTKSSETHDGKSGYWHRVNNCGAWVFGGYIQKN